jgi:hypothetical protein
MFHARGTGLLALSARPLAALLPVPAAFAAGGVLARWWLERAPHRLETALAQPLVVVDGWGAYGGVALAILTGTVFVAAIALVLAMRGSDRKGGPGSLAEIELCAALAIAFAIGWPFVFSTDVSAYAAYGTMALDGLDPYAPLPPGARGTFLDQAREGAAPLPFPPCPYGPLFVAVATAIVRIAAPLGPAATLLALRVSAGLAFLGSIALLHRALAGATPQRRDLALCAYGLNPLCLWSVAEGHNDAFLLLAIFGAAVLARRRPALGAFVFGLSPVLKAPGAAFALADALDAWLVGRRLRLRIAGAALAGLALSAIVALPALRLALSELARVHHVPASLRGQLVMAVPLASAALAAVYGLRRLGLRDAAGHAWLGIALALALPQWHPWYALWLVPWCIAAGTGWASRALWAATISAVIRYLPDATASLGPEASHAVEAAAALPLVLALAGVFPPAFVRNANSIAAKSPP